MDNLKSCYSVPVRLRLNPELIGTLTWYFAPKGALPFPGAHAFGSMVWDSDWFHADQGDLGEISTARTWSGGAAPFGVSGQGTPTPLDWFLHGLPASVAGPCAGCPGTLPTGPLLWLRPEELAGIKVGDTIQTWPPAPYTAIPGHGLVPPQTPTACALEPVTRLKSAHLQAFPAPKLESVLLTGTNVPLGRDYAFYLVASVGDPVGNAQSGPLVQGNAPVSTVLNGVANLNFFHVPGSMLQQGPDPYAPGKVHVWRVRVSGGTHVTMDRADCGPFRWTTIIDNTGVFTAGEFHEYQCSISNVFNDVWMLETIFWPRTLTAAELAAVDCYLGGKYCAEECDMLIGQIVWDSGVDAIPPKFLLADGSAVSRATYSLYFGRVGTTYGPGNGTTTFNLPNVRDRVPIGSGLSYTTGAQGGEAMHQLTAAEMPGHTHPSPSGNDFAETGGVQLAAGPDWPGSTDSGSTHTGIAGTNKPHNNLQPYLALRPLVYVGV